MDVGNRILGVAFCLVTAVTAAIAQEPAGHRVFGQDGFAMPPRLTGVPTPEALRNSMSFAVHSADSSWLKPELPRWRMPDSVMLRPAGSRNVGGVVPASGGTPFHANPYAFDFNTGGVVTAWNNGAVVGSGFRTTMPGLMSRHNASVGVVQGVGNLTVSAGVSADRYLLWRGMRTVYGIGGSLNYRFNDNWSATVFGRYSSKSPFYSMAAMPYMAASGYGGYVSYMGGTLGIDFGVERFYDTFARRWVTSPIITPKVRVSEKLTIELPVGWLVKEMIDNAVRKRKNNGGPMIMPQGVPSVGEIPFGTPEAPK